MASAAALIIGNEILSGKTEDRNTPALARELRAAGVELRRVLVVPDELDDIVEGVRLLAPRHDWVFTSGGVGPTHDDITLEAVALALGRSLVRNDELAELIARHHDVGKFPLALRMADLPQGAVLVRGEDLRVPVVRVENLFVLPGVPSLFERKLRSLRPLLLGEPWHLRLVFVAAEEVDIAQALYDLVAVHPGLQVGSYPEWGRDDYKVKLTLETRDLALADRALADLLERLPPDAVVRTE